MHLVIDPMTRRVQPWAKILELICKVPLFPSAGRAACLRKHVGRISAFTTQLVNYGGHYRIKSTAENDGRGVPKGAKGHRPTLHFLWAIKTCLTLPDRSQALPAASQSLLITSRHLGK